MAYRERTRWLTGLSWPRRTLLVLAALGCLSLFVAQNRGQDPEDISWTPLNASRVTVRKTTEYSVPAPTWSNLEASGGSQPPDSEIILPLELENPASSIGRGWKSKPGAASRSSQPFPPLGSKGELIPVQGLERQADPNFLPSQLIRQEINVLPKNPRLVPGIPVAFPDPENLPAPREAQPKEPALEPRETSTDGKDNPERNLLLGAARNAVKQGNFDQAVQRFQEVFKRFGDNFEIRKEFAGVLAQSGRSEEALAQIKQLLQRKPDDLAMRITAGDLNITLIRYREAIAHYQQAVTQSPDRLDIVTKLARAHIFDENTCEALKLYDQKLSKVQTDDDIIPANLPALMVDLEFLERAIAFLTVQNQENPKDLEVLMTLVRAYAYQGDREKTQKTLADLTARPNSQAKRQELGDVLFAAGEYDWAASIYGQLLQENPGDQAALIGSARVQLELYLPREAWALLKSFTPNERMQRLHRLTWAEYHQRVGEYLEAKQIYREFLRKNDNDYEARVALAALLEFIREDEKAKAEYAKVPPTHSLSHKARLGIASTLTQQRFFKQSVDVTKQLLAENCGDGSAMAQLVRTLGKMEEFDKAIILGNGFLEAQQRNISASRAVRMALGKVMLDAHRSQEAAQNYEQVLSLHRGRLPAAYYGLARAARLMGQGEKSVAVLHTVLTPIGGDNRARILYADLFYADQEDAIAVEMTDAVLRLDPDNLAALIRKVDALGRMARRDANIKPTVEVAKHILGLSPTNVRAHLTLSRSLATSQAYPASAGAYEKLIALDNDFFIPQRERARVINSDSRFGEAQSAYHQMLHPSADEILVGDLAALSLRKPGLAKALDPYLLANLPGTQLEIELQKAFCNCTDTEFNEALHRIFLDYRARCTDHNVIKLEAEVKDKIWRPLEVIPIEKKLLAVEPTNTAVWFDHGQTYGTLKMTPLAISQFSNEIKVDPQARESAIAMERASFELNPQLHFGYDHFFQRGRDGLADMKRNRYSSFVRIPFGDEEEFFQLGFARQDLIPPDDTELNGNIPSFRVQKKYCEGLFLAHAQFNYEDYRDRINDRLTFDIGARYYFSDPLKFRASVFKENVLENGEALRQDIHRTGLRLGADYQPTRRWNMSGTFTYANYSDDNDSGDFFFNTDYILTFPPCMLKAALTSDILSFREQTIFAVPDQAPGAIHPYFSPSMYVYNEARIEYYQWLSRDYFIYANQCWFSLQYGLGFDNSFNAYSNFHAIVNWDVHSALSLRADARYTTSDVYEAKSLMGYLVLRSPWCLW